MSFESGTHRLEEEVLPMQSLEERVLRVLYEGSASAFDCAAELQRYGEGHGGLTTEIHHLLTDLAERSYLEVRGSNGAARYRLTPAGSERLATLVERSA
jgi:DNA-binding PadR family transcriptional regulator